MNALSLFPVDGNTERFICLSVLGDTIVRHVGSDDIKQWKNHFPWVSENRCDEAWEFADWGDEVLIVNTDRTPTPALIALLRAHDFQRIFAYPDFNVILGLVSVYEREYYLVFNHNGWGQHLMWRKKIDYDAVVPKDPTPQFTAKKSAFSLFKSISRPNMRRKLRDEIHRV